MHSFLGEGWVKASSLNDADAVMAMVAMDLHPVEPVDHENTMIPGELIRHLGEVTRPTTPTMQ